MVNHALMSAGIGIRRGCENLRTSSRGTDNLTCGSDKKPERFHDPGLDLMPRLKISSKESFHFSFTRYLYSFCALSRPDVSQVDGGRHTGSFNPAACGCSLVASSAITCGSSCLRSWRKRLFASSVMGAPV